MPKPKVNFRLSPGAFAMLNELAQGGKEKTLLVEEAIALVYAEQKGKENEAKQDNERLNAMDTPASQGLAKEKLASDSEILLSKKELLAMLEEAYLNGKQSGVG